MESAPAAAAVTLLLGKREPSVDPVKAEGILSSLTAKERATAQEWSKRWGFYKQARQMLEEEALATGMTREEYRSALQQLSCEPDPAEYPVQVQPSPAPPPPTSSGIIGRRARYSLERYGRLVKTPRDYPLEPPLQPGQIYNPYKQTIIFLGIDCGDPISYNLCCRGDEVPAQARRASLHPHVAPLSRDTLHRARARAAAAAAADTRHHHTAFSHMS